MNRTKLSQIPLPICSFKIITATLATAALLLAASHAPAQTKLPQDIADAFELNNGNLISLDIDTTPGVDVSTEITIDDQEYTLNLFPHSIRTEKFVLKEQLADGSFRIVEPGPTRTVKGSLFESKTSRVVGSILESGLSAKIVMADGDVRFIEPVASKLPKIEQQNLHIVYRSVDARPIDATCAVVDGPLHHFENVRRAQDHRRRFRSHKDDVEVAAGSIPNIAVCEVGVDADFEFFTNWVTTTATMNRMEQVLNIVNDQYQTEVSIIHQISGAVVRTNINDPYTSSNAFTLLDQFENEWLFNQQSIQRDVAHLFTGREIDGTTVGLAAVGTICTSAGFGLVQSDIGALACVTDLSAHELGHNWSANHCNCNTFTMNSSLTCSNRFTTASENSINNHKNTRNCLDFLAPDNDDFSQSISIGGFPTTVNGNNLGGTTQAGEQDLDQTGSTVWWSFIAPGTGIVRVDLAGSDFDTQLQIYTGMENGFENLQRVAYNDDEQNNSYSDVRFPVNGFQRYEIRVGGFTNGGTPQTGQIDLNVTFLPQGATQFFYSDKNFDNGAINFSNFFGDFGTGSSGSLYMYFDPTVTDIDTGAFFDISTSDSGVIEFTSAESLEFDIFAGGNPIDLRWGDGVGETGTVSTEFIEGIGALTVLNGSGMLSMNTGPIFFDQGYDADASAFLFARIDFDVVGPIGSSVDIITNRGLTNIVHSGIALDPTIGSFKINVVEETFLLGDINCDGVVNLLDVQPFVDLLSSGEFSAKGDFDGNGVVNLLDVGPFIDALSGS